MKSLSSQFPPTFDPVGNGNWWYNYNVQEVIQQLEEDSITVYEYETVQIQGSIDSNKVLRAVLAEKYPVDVEQKLINDYNASTLGVLEDYDATRYIEYLQYRNTMKNLIEQDCKNNGYN